jgi:copper chaperone NosL
MTRPVSSGAGLRGARLSRRRFLLGLALVPAGLALASCTRPVDASEPPTIRYGTDVCARCGMIISEAAYAAAYRTSAGDARLFDDIGCMVLQHREQREPVAAFFVHDQATARWLAAEDASYVVGSRLRTPMGFGVAAFAREAEARALADQQGGRVVGFKELLEEAEPQPAQSHRKH